MSEAHIDNQVLASLREVMEEEYPVLLDTFLVDSDERLRLLREAEGHRVQRLDLIRLLHHAGGEIFVAVFGNDDVIFNTNADAAILGRHVGIGGEIGRAHV